jgi:hypothetical protein
LGWHIVGSVIDRLSYSEHSHAFRQSFEPALAGRANLDMAYKPGITLGVDLTVQQS